MVFIAITDKAGATLVVSYKGAHAMRPADEVDVDSFIGVKSARAKGKRITTYEVDTLRFIEPEPMPEESVEDGNDESNDVDAVVDDASAVEVDFERMESLSADDVEGESNDMDDEPTQTPEPSADEVIVIDTAQLNLF
jgi:topoisomerase-4 subunit A